MPERAKTAELRSQFPGELALRDLPVRDAQEFVGLIAARFVMLQLIERIAHGGIEPHLLALELDSAVEYVTAIRRHAPADAMRLQRLADRVRRKEMRAVASALLSVGDTALVRAHRYAAFGFFRASHVLSNELKWDAAKLSSADRLAIVARELGRKREAAHWEQRRRRLVSRCH